MRFLHSLQAMDWNRLGLCAGVGSLSEVRANRELGFLEHVSMWPKIPSSRFPHSEHTPDLDTRLGGDVAVNGARKASGVETIGDGFLEHQSRCPVFCSSSPVCLHSGH